MTREKIYGACPHDCPDTCGFVSEVEDSRVVNFYADETHPIADGWLCAKVRPYLDHVYHPERLQFPLRRVGAKGAGAWERMSWDEAIAKIGTKWREIIAEHGAEAILPYSYSGTLGLVQMTVTNGRFWNRLGASQLQRTICGAAAEIAVEATLGARHTARYEDVAHSQLVVVWGHNPVSTSPHFMPHLAEARRNGCQLVVIDPRRTRTAKMADWHIAPLPGTDGALALGVAHVIVREGWQDEAWLAAHTVGWPELRERLAEYPPNVVAGMCGVAEADIVQLAKMMADSKPFFIKIADGLQRNHNGGQTVRAICALPTMLGQYGKLGGGLMYSASGFAKWDWEAVGKKSECPPSTRWINMNRLGAALLGEASDPPIQSLFVYGANPAAISPNAGRIVEGMLREDLFTVVHELFMTDTAVYADIVLPATSQLEQTDVVKAYGNRTLTYNQQAIAPLGEAKSNWELMGLLAKEMGFTESWLYQTPEEVIEEVLTATAAKNPALEGITLQRLQNEHHIELNVPDVPFADGHFPTASGKVELYCKGMLTMGYEPLPYYANKHDLGGQDGVAANGRFQADESLQLITGAAHHFVTSSFANQPNLLKKEGDPFVEIHPQDAEKRDIVTGDMVIVENGRGWCELVAKVTDGIKQGVLASPKGYWGRNNVNWTTSDELGDMAGQSTFHSNRVWLRKRD